MTYQIKPYRKKYEKALISLLKDEGDDWLCYHQDQSVDLYILNVEKSITYLLFEETHLIGYIRALEDHGFYIYICDLLVSKNHRHKGYGKMLMSYIKSLYPKHDCFVMSDVDPYYEKLGLKKEGSIFIL